VEINFFLSLNFQEGGFARLGLRIKVAEYGCYAKIGIVSCSAGWCKEHAVEAGLDFKTKPVKESGISLCSCDWNMVLREGCQCGGR
jgi:hypothetical protein